MSVIKAWISCDHCILEKKSPDPENKVYDILHVPIDERIVFDIYTGGFLCKCRKSVCKICKRCVEDCYGSRKHHLYSCINFLMGIFNDRKNDISIDFGGAGSSIYRIETLLGCDYGAFLLFNIQYEMDYKNKIIDLFREYYDIYKILINIMNPFQELPEICRKIIEQCFQIKRIICESVYESTPTREIYMNHVIKCIDKHKLFGV